LISNLISLKSVEGRNPSTHEIYKRLSYSAEKEEQRFKKLEKLEKQTIMSCYLAVKVVEYNLFQLHHPFRIPVFISVPQWWMYGGSSSWYI